MKTASCKSAWLAVCWRTQRGHVGLEIESMKDTARSDSAMLQDVDCADTQDEHTQGRQIITAEQC